MSKRNKDGACDKSSGKGEIDQCGTGNESVSVQTNSTI